LALGEQSAQKRRRRQIFWCCAVVVATAAAVSIVSINLELLVVVAGDVVAYKASCASGFIKVVQAVEVRQSRRDGPE